MCSMVVRPTWSLLLRSARTWPAPRGSTGACSPSSWCASTSATPPPTWSSPPHTSTATPGTCTWCKQLNDIKYIIRNPRSRTLIKCFYNFWYCIKHMVVFRVFSVHGGRIVEETPFSVPLTEEFENKIRSQLRQRSKLNLDDLVAHFKLWGSDGDMHFISSDPYGFKTL